MSHGEGCWIHTTDGRKFLDMASGACRTGRGGYCHIITVTLGRLRFAGSHIGATWAAAAFKLCRGHGYCCR